MEDKKIIALYNKKAVLKGWNGLYGCSSYIINTDYYNNK